MQMLLGWGPAVAAAYIGYLAASQVLLLLKLLSPVLLFMDAWSDLTSVPGSMALLDWGLGGI